MGNSSKRLAERCTILSRAEQPTVATCFQIVSHNHDHLREEDLTKEWSALMDPSMLPFLCNFMFGRDSNHHGQTDFQRFAEFYVYGTRGTLDERVKAVYMCLGAPEGSILLNRQVQEYCGAIVSTYMKLQKLWPDAELTAWAEKGFAVKRDRLAALAEGLASSLANPATTTAVALWLQENTLLQRVTEHVIWRLYRGIRPRIEVPQIEEETAPASLLPEPIGLEFMPDYPTVIDLSQMLFLTSQLPPDLQTQWRFLFSSNIHGESFSTLLGRIMDQGPSILIVEDSKGHLFGGFAPHSWTLSPNFSGDDSAFLFMLSPQMRVYQATDYNDHYQYLNLHQQTMPNGLMMGGQFGFCGLWLDSAYGDGQSVESCTTYRHYRQLSSTKDFTIRNLEVWGLGDKPLSEVEKGNRSATSILDSNTESKVMLRLAGHEQHSDGLRDSPPL